MMLSSADFSVGVDSGPVSPLNYKRALLRSPPREFTVEVLPPAKYGRNWNYGLKVCPILRQKRTSDSQSSSSSSSSYSEYEIWRSWEDCLDFQETLEDEYSKLSRQKVKILRRGGKKKDVEGFYTLNNAAASFESLPEGPDYREVVTDVHELIPSLTRKGTLFKISRSTVNRRGDEFAAMIQALFDASEDAPVLLQDLRNSTSVRDFFGFWRRDGDLHKKASRDTDSFRPTNKSLSSLPSSSLSSPSRSFFSDVQISPASLSGSIARSMSTTPGFFRRDGRTPNPSMPAIASPRDNCFPRSLTPSSQHRQVRYTEDAGFGSILFTDELLLDDDSGTSVESARRSYPLAPIPTYPDSSLRKKELTLPHASDVHETYTSKPRIPDPIPEEGFPRPLRARVDPERRNARIFITDPEPLTLDTKEQRRSNVDLRPENPSPTSPYSASPSSRFFSLSLAPFSIASSISSFAMSKRSTFNRDSRQSFQSDASLEIDMPFASSPVLSSPPTDVPNSMHQGRESVASFASGRTDLSAYGVIPRHLRPSMMQRRRSFSAGSRYDYRTSKMDQRAPSFINESLSEDGESPISSYFEDPEFTMEPMAIELPPFISHETKSSSSSSGSSAESHALSDGSFAVKALYRDTVVVFRADRVMPLATIRQRIRDKFALHEGVRLDQNFILEYLLPSHDVNKNFVRARGRSNSGASYQSQLQTIDSVTHWHSITTTCGGKVTLRVHDREDLA